MTGYKTSAMARTNRKPAFTPDLQSVMVRIHKPSKYRKIVQSKAYEKQSKPVDSPRAVWRKGQFEKPLSMTVASRISSGDGNYVQPAA